MCLGACATYEPIPVAFGPHDLDETLKPDTSIACPVTVAKFTDARGRDRQIGYIGSRPVLSDSLVPLVENALRSLESAPGPATRAPALRLSVTLRKLYVHSMPATKSAIIVVDGALYRDRSQPVHRTYRGRSTSILWTSGPTEIKSAIRSAWLDLKAALRSDLKVLCDA